MSGLDTLDQLEATQKVFEPQLPEGSAIAFLFTGIILYGATQVWWNSVIPQKRTELAKSKRDGDVKEYLDGLREIGDSVDQSEDERGLEKWLFADWIRTADKERTGPKPGALPFLKKAKWNSGDNPILVAFGAIMACVITSSLAERSQFLH